MVAQIDAGTIWAIVVPVCVSIIGGGLAMAWRLGGLSTKVEELAEDVRDLRDQVRHLR